MLSRVIQFVKEHQSDIILLIGVILISLLSFATGYIVAKTQEKEPLRFEEDLLFISPRFHTFLIKNHENSNNWSGNLRIIPGLEIG